MWGFWLLCLVQPQVFASDHDDAPQRIVSLELGNDLQNLDGEGFYADLLGSVLTPMGTPYQFQILPLRRSIEAFVVGNADCLWGFDRATFEGVHGSAIPLLESTPFITATLHFVTFGLPEQFRVTAKSEVLGQKIAASNGTFYVPMLRGMGAETVFVNDQDSKVKLLRSGRVFAALLWYPDVLSFRFEEGEARLIWDPNLILHTTNMNLLCHPGERNQAFIEAVNRRVESPDWEGTVASRLRSYASGENAHGNPD